MYLIMSFIVMSSFIAASDSMSLVNRKYKVMQHSTNTQLDECAKNTDEYKLLKHARSFETYGKAIFKNLISKDAMVVVLASKKTIELCNSNLHPQAQIGIPDNIYHNDYKDVTLSPSDKILLVLREQNCTTFDVQTKEENDVGLKHPARRAAFLDDNTFVAGTTAGISLYDLRNNQEIECVNQKHYTLTALDHIENEITVATGYTNGLINLWDLRNPVKPLKEWNKNTSKTSQVIDLKYTDEYALWVDENDHLHLADIPTAQPLLSHKIKRSFLHASNHCLCLSKVNARQVAIGYENKIQLIDLSSLQCHTATVEDDLVEFATHDTFYITTHYRDKISTVHKWIPATQEEVNLMKYKTSTPKKNN